MREVKMWGVSTIGGEEIGRPGRPGCYPHPQLFDRKSSAERYASNYNGETRARRGNPRRLYVVPVTISWPVPTSP